MTHLSNEIKEFLTCAAEKIIFLGFTNCEVRDGRETIILVEMHEEIATSHSEANAEETESSCTRISFRKGARIVMTRTKGEMFIAHSKERCDAGVDIGRQHIKMTAKRMLHSKGTQKITQIKIEVSAFS